MKERPRFPARLDFSVGKPTTNQPGSAPARMPVKAAAKASVSLVPQGHGMDSSAVRMNMVQKLRQQGISDPLVLEAMGTIERHRFVDSALGNQAYEDTSLPIGLGQTISKPGVVSRMAELLRNGA
jgi:protein-L-isoaspartate(D-aspartate) O-methyltransferase